MEDQRDQLESLRARSDFKDYSHGVGKIYGGVFRSWSSYWVKKLRWVFRRRMRTCPESLAWDVADLFCSRLASINTTKKQVRIGYEAGKCHLRHVLVINAWQSLLDPPAGTVCDSPSCSVGHSHCPSVHVHTGFPLSSLNCLSLKKPTCPCAACSQNLTLS